MPRIGLLEDRQLSIALALTAGGALSFGFAVRQHPGALSMLPAMDGCLTIGLVGFALALLGGVPYLRALLLMSPVVAIQLLGARTYGMSPVALLGLEALAYGVLGTAIALHGRSASAPAVAPQRAMPERREEAAVHGRRGLART